MQLTIDEINKQFKIKLKGIYSSDEIQQLLFLVYESVLGFNKIKILTNFDLLIGEEDCDKIIHIKERLCQNEPIQYIIGEEYFFDLKFKVEPTVLIPRPETEELVQWVIDSCGSKSIKILDVGTGSGCIAISLAKNILNSNVYAVDISVSALNIAKLNALNNKVPVKFIEHNILKSNYSILPQKIDIIVSNPPYIKNNEKALMRKNVLDYEPDIALFVSDDNPLIFYKKIAEIGITQLKKNGELFFEINEALGNEVENMLRDMNYYNIEIRKDLNGKDRMVKAIYI